MDALAAAGAAAAVPIGADANPDQDMRSLGVRVLMPVAKNAQRLLKENSRRTRIMMTTPQPSEHGEACNAKVSKATPMLRKTPCA